MGKSEKGRFDLIGM